MIGSTISHYRIVSELGRGGMGIVYRAEDTRLGRSVALKVLPGHLTVRSDARVRFEQEARAASMLEHPNICSIHHVGETEDGQFYIVMPCYQGQTLADRIKEGPLEIAEAVSICRQVLSGLQKAHEAGMVHRDIKPANVMLVDGRAVIMDFGLAKLAGIEELTTTGSTVGSLAYMSPEQARGDDLDPRSDLWSVGVVLYEMLAGRRPFQAPYAEAQLYAVLNTDPEPIDTVRAGMTESVAGVVHRLLEKDATTRYASAREVLDDLEAGSASPHGTTPMQRPSTSRLRSARGVIFAVIALSVLSILVYQFTRTGRGTSAGVQSLAIFPFTAGTGVEPDFAREATAQITERLKRYDALPVAPVSRSAAELEIGVSPLEAAVRMGVDMYMTGHVTRTAGLVSIEIFLADTRSDVLIGSRTYTRPDSSILGLYDDVARVVIGTSGFVLTAEEERQLSTHHRVDPEAYRLLMRGRATRYAAEAPDLHRGIEYVLQAIEIDSTFAEAYSELAHLYVLVSQIEGMSNYSKSLQAAEKAIRLDSLAQLAWASLGMYHLFYSWDWEASEKALRRALAIAPQSTEARLTLVLLLTSRGQRSEARRELQRARQYDAYSYTGREYSQLAYQFNRDYEEGIAFSRETLDIYPDARVTRVQLGTMLALTGQSEEAIVELDKVMPGPGKVEEGKLGPLYTAFGMAGYAIAGADDRARALIPEMEEIAGERFFCTYELALVYVQLGEMDQAFRWLDNAVDQHAECVPFMLADERLDPFRSDGRYQGLVDRVGF